MGMGDRARLGYWSRGRGVASYATAPSRSGSATASWLPVQSSAASAGQRVSGSAIGQRVSYRSAGQL